MLGCSSGSCKMYFIHPDQGHISWVSHEKCICENRVDTSLHTPSKMEGYFLANKRVEHS